MYIELERYVDLVEDHATLELIREHLQKGEEQNENESEMLACVRLFLECNNRRRADRKVGMK